MFNSSVIIKDQEILVAAFCFSVKADINKRDTTSHKEVFGGIIDLCGLIWRVLR